MATEWTSSFGGYTWMQVIVLLLSSAMCSCASTPPPKREPTPVEKVGELELPATDCFASLPQGASDILMRRLETGEQLESVENFRKDLVAVHLKNGSTRRTIWLQNYGDGQWEEALEPPGSNR